MSLELTCKIDRILGTIGYHLLKRSVPERSKVRPETVKVIAVVKFLGGGSLTLAAPALLALKKRYPDAEFLLLTTPAVRANAELLGIYDRIFLFSPRKPFSAFKTLFQLKHLLSATASILLDLELYSRFTHILTAWLSPAYSVGLALDGEKTLWDETLTVTPDLPMYEAYDRAARSAGAEEFPEYPQKQWTVPAEERTKQLLIAPFCSALSLRREWDFDNWASLLDDFLALHEDFTAIILGAPSDRERGEALRQMLSETHQQKVKSWCGTADFKMAFDAIRHAAIFVGIDSAPLHLARLSGTPAVSLWGATDPVSLARPFKDYPEILLFARQNCTPCVHKENFPCPFSGSCTAQISCCDVLNAAEELLEGKVASTKFITPDIVEEEK